VNFLRYIEEKKHGREVRFNEKVTDARTLLLKKIKELSQAVEKQEFWVQTRRNPMQ